jgi:DNA-dependent metalloprotease WSS1
MCCCEDGLDYLNSKKNDGKRGRKTRKMPNNVLGYNLTQGSSHRIHLRLRNPTSHGTFYSYEEIAGTMCHELAHCERGPHDAKFYKIMDEIQEQYAVYLISGVVKDKEGFPIGSDQAFVLGGRNKSSYTGSRTEREQAAVSRQNKSKLGGTFVLGGGLLPGSDLYSSLKHLPPAEAARIAAERRIEERRKNDSKFCLPCQEVIEILDGSSSEDEEKDENTFTDDADKKIPAMDQATTSDRRTNSEIIVLCDSSSDEDTYPSVEQGNNRLLPSCVNRNSSNEKRSNWIKSPMYSDSWCCSGCNFVNDSNVKKCCRCKEKMSASLKTNIDRWACKSCTFENRNDATVCDICYQERPKMARLTKRIIQDIIRKDTIEDVKQFEIEKSKEQFNGFNIYGDQKRGTGTLNHLT